MEGTFQEVIGGTWTPKMPLTACIILKQEEKILFQARNVILIIMNAMFDVPDQKDLLHPLILL